MQSLAFVSHCALAYTLDLSYIYVVCMWIYVFGICSLLLLFLCLAFLSFTHLLLLLHLLNQLIITELFSISCFSRSLG